MIRDMSLEDAAQQLQTTEAARLREEQAERRGQGAEGPHDRPRHQEAEERRAGEHREPDHHEPGPW
jgi:hypothetical protein